MTPDQLDQLAAAMSEKQLQQNVADLCRVLGLAHWHVRDSRGMPPGWPDSAIVGTRLLLRELKSEAGRLTPDQRRAGSWMQAAGLDWAVWRPTHWYDGTIERELRGIVPAGLRYRGRP